jgi:hypothetical protein
MIPHAPIFSSTRARYDTAHARLYSVRTRSLFSRARFDSVRARKTHVSVHEILVHTHCLRVRAQRRIVYALEHLVHAGINAFAPEGSRKTTATCAWGTISSRPFAVHSVQSPCTLAYNCACNCLPCTSWVRTKADFIEPPGWMRLARSSWLWIQTMGIEGLLKLKKRNKIREGEGRGRCIRSVCTSYLIRISMPSKGGKLWLSRGPLQHVRNLLNGATLGSHSHLPAMEFIENIM